MTKNDIERCVKRYPYIKRLIEGNKPEISFYIGNRKKKIRLTEELKIIYGVIDDILENLQEKWQKDVIKGILSGKTDVYLLQVCPCGRSLYYATKKEFIETIYRGCIAKQMISYEELIQIRRAK